MPASSQHEGGDPHVLEFNRYIASGYRANLSCGQWACSVLGCHDETGAPHSPSKPPPAASRGITPLAAGASGDT